jgi:hypothetical protein
MHQRNDCCKVTTPTRVVTNCEHDPSPYLDVFRFSTYPFGNMRREIFGPLQLPNPEGDDFVVSAGWAKIILTVPGMPRRGVSAVRGCPECQSDIEEPDISQVIEKPDAIRSW